ncbi:putative nucleotide-binding containing TIR-like domain protein [Burkholderia cepacia]|jgi:predicted nucleotide-binding protein|nr:putative nucleotide-binding containing TIR-like domain protein [Burkholderia cepacia]KGB94560.1 putative nucleotide-binding containing TIR-like domain protein [Burkholderia cepacia]
MQTVAVVMAKLAGIHKTLSAALNEERNGTHARAVPIRIFHPRTVGHQFKQATELVDQLRSLLPDLYGDFQHMDFEPHAEIAGTPADGVRHWYARSQLEQLKRDLDQVFEIRANSELSQPTDQAKSGDKKLVFISHGRSNDWREVQAYIEKDVGISTIELAQEANAGLTIIEKLEKNAAECDSAVIVMTGDDIDSDGLARARENVMHEIGYFQAKYGRARVCLLHEEGVNIPTNLSGVVYVPFPKGNVSASFGVLVRELKAMYKL